MMMQTDGKTQRIVMLTAKDECGKIVDFYKNKLEEGGWRICNSSTNRASGLTIGALAAIKNKSSLDVAVIGGQPEISISLTYTQ